MPVATSVSSHSATELAALVLPEAERQVAEGSLPATLGARTEADLHLGMARAHRRRVQGRPSARSWAKPRRGLDGTGHPVPGRQGSLVAVPR